MPKDIDPKQTPAVSVGEPLGSNPIMMSNLDEATTRAPGPINTPFSWLPSSMQGRTNAEFVARTRNVSKGVRTCLQLMHNDILDRCSEQPTLLSVNEIEHLMLLATEALGMLAEDADKQIEHMHETARKAVAA